MGFFAGKKREVGCFALFFSFVCCHQSIAQSTSVDVSEARNFSSDLDVTAQQQLGTLAGNTGLRVGSFVRNFKLKNHQGDVSELYDILEDRTVVIVFYRGGWSSTCNTQIHQLTENWLEFEKRSVSVILISVDNIAASEKTQRIHQTPFFVLSDPDLNAHSVFNVVDSVDDISFESLQARNINIETWSNRQHHKLAVPSVFVVERTRTVSWAHTSVDVSIRPSAKQILSVLDSLN